MKSKGSVVTYLIFEFLIPACYRPTYTYTCAVHTVYENSLLFSLEYQTRGVTVVLGSPAKYNNEAPGGGGVVGMGGGLSEARGASNFLAPALLVPYCSYAVPFSAKRPISIILRFSLRLCVCASASAKKQKK